MAQLKVIVNKLNKRDAVPASFSDKNIMGTVQKGFLFEGNEVNGIANTLGKWYEDRDGHFYWGGGLLVLDIPLGITINVKDLPANLPHPFRIGIDISHHNKLSDWAAIKNAGVTFTYIKISEGVGTPDLTAKEYAGTAKLNNLKIGYYHFSHPDTRNGGTVVSDATAEADDALKRIKNLPFPDLPLALDLETFSGNVDSPLKPVEYLTWVNTFINRIKEQLGLDVILYGTKNYLETHLPAKHDLGVKKLWIAHYGLKDTSSLKSPINWNDWAMWQYRDDGMIGSNSKLDINILKDQSLF